MLRGQYHRFMRRRQTTLNTAAERNELLETLSSAPGARNVEIIEAHAKGGYRTRFELNFDELHAFISYMEEKDWMSVF
jgi:hypothetical protein